MLRAPGPSFLIPCSGSVTEPPPPSWGGRRGSRRWAASIGMKKKKMWVHHLGNWECHSRLWHPKQSCQKGLTFGHKAITDLTHGSRVTINHDLFILRRNIYASAHFTTRFPGHAFVKRKSTETKDKKTLGKQMKGPIGNTSRQGTRDKKKRNEDRERKKRCGFIMFVNESAAAGCDIPNDSLAGIFFRHMAAAVRGCFKLRSLETSLLRRSMSGSSWQKIQGTVQIDATFPINLCPNLYRIAHFTMRFPGHAFCCASTQIEERR